MSIWVAHRSAVCLECCGAMYVYLKLLSLSGVYFRVFHLTCVYLEICGINGCLFWGMWFDVSVERPCSASPNELLFAHPPFPSLSIPVMYSLSVWYSPFGTTGFLWEVKFHASSLHILTHVPLFSERRCVLTSTYFKVTVFNQFVSGFIQTCLCGF